MVTNTFMRIVSPCWKPSAEGENSSGGNDVYGRVDGLLWYKDLGQHVAGEFSMAVIQANNLLEDQSQLESGSLSSNNSAPHVTFFGVYDGHGGPEAARFVNQHLLENLKTFSRKLSDVLWEAISNNQILSLYQGLGTKNLPSFLSQFIYFYGYSYFKRLYMEKSGNMKFGTQANLLIAAAAGACTAIVTQPLDSILKNVD